MAKRIVQIKHTCRNCAHATDFHELNHKGEPFLCKCPFEEWSQFLDLEKVCEHYKLL